MSLSQYALNILAVYALASGTQLVAGRGWYAAAQCAAAEMSTRYGLPLEQCAGVIAALSPSNPWAKNLADSELVLSGWVAGVAPRDVRRANGRGVGMGAPLDKCARILAGEDIAAVLSGLKTVAFWRCILGDSEAVCVDGHAQHIALHGMRRVGITGARGMTPKQYATYAAAYCEAARVLGESPAVVQAVTWEVYRGLNIVQGGKKAVKGVK